MSNFATTACCSATVILNTAYPHELWHRRFLCGRAVANQDFAACAAVAVEGLTPPSKSGFADAAHQVSVQSETHQEFTSRILRGLDGYAWSCRSRHVHRIDAIFLVTFSNNTSHLYRTKHFEPRQWSTSANISALLVSRRLPRLLITPKFVVSPNRQVLGVRAEIFDTARDRRRLGMAGFF